MRGAAGYKNEYQDKNLLNQSPVRNPRMHFENAWPELFDKKTFRNKREYLGGTATWAEGI